jgi:hypothetical protein
MVDHEISIDERIPEALKLINNEIKPPILSAIAKKLDVPYQRLRARYHGRKPKSHIKPSQRLLIGIQGKSLTKWNLFLDSYQIRPILLWL